MHHHHDEYNFKDDIELVNELASYLKKNYLKLPFKIYLILCCNDCYNIDMEYSTLDDNVCIVHSVDGNICKCIKEHILPKLE